MWTTMQEKLTDQIKCGTGSMTDNQIIIIITIIFLLLTYFKLIYFLIFSRCSWKNEKQESYAIAKMTAQCAL